MLPFWLSFASLLLALNGSQRAKKEVGPSQRATGKTSSCLWLIDKGEEQIDKRMQEPKVPVSSPRTGHPMRRQAGKKINIRESASLERS